MGIGEVLRFLYVKQWGDWKLKIQGGAANGN